MRIAVRVPCSSDFGLQPVANPVPDPVVWNRRRLCHRYIACRSELIADTFSHRRVATGDEDSCAVHFCVMDHNRKCDVLAVCSRAKCECDRVRNTRLVRGKRVDPHPEVVAEVERGTIMPAWSALICA